LTNSIPQITDSIIADQPLFQKDTLSNAIITSLFEGKPIIEQSTQSIELEKLIHFPDWLTLVFLGMIIYLVLIRFIFNIDFIESLKGLLKIESLDVVGFDKTNQRTAFVLSPISAIIYSYYFYFFINPHYILLDIDYLFFISSISIILLFFTKVFIEYSIATLFNTLKTYDIFLIDHLYILSISSLIQLPFILLFTYNQAMIFIWISLALLLFFLVLRLIRGFIIGYQQSQFSKSYIFLYLCSLEILPIIWAWKWLLNNQ